jgi:hypothetical protein
VVVVSDQSKKQAICEQESGYSDKIEAGGQDTPEGYRKIPKTGLSSEDNKLRR